MLRTFGVDWELNISKPCKVIPLAGLKLSNMASFNLFHFIVKNGKMNTRLQILVEWPTLI